MRTPFALCLMLMLPFQVNAASLTPLTDEAPLALSAPGGNADSGLDAAVFGHTPGADTGLAFIEGPVLGSNPLRAILPPDQWARPEGVAPNVLIHSR